MARFVRSTTHGAYASSLVGKSSKGEFFGVHGYNNGADQWIMIFDASSLPVDGTTPKLRFKVDAQSNFFGTQDLLSYAMQTGIVVANSTTAETLTNGAADCLFHVDWR
jgi:hypothetical protein